jgi:hypothetical protein
LFRVLVACVVLAGCGRAGEASPQKLERILTPAAQELAVRRPRPLPPSQPASQPASRPATTAPGLDRAACQREWARVAALPALPGTPKLDGDRAEALARAKGEPVIFVRAPAYDETKSRSVRGYRKTLGESRFPWDLLHNIHDRFQSAPRVAREVVLRDGYFYADTAELGWALWDYVRLEQLFDEPAIVIERGSARLRVERDPKRGLYIHVDGPDAGQPARLLLFDRVSVAGEDRGPPLHRDVRTLAHELGFERMKIERITEERLLAKLRYGNVWVPSVLASRGASVKLFCEIEPQEGRAELAEAKTRARTRARVLDRMRTAMLAMVADALPFDEPRRELGQQDGHLRSHWQRAYESGESAYGFNNDNYSVFTAAGEASPPQVCIDFVTETLERASGTWWRGRGKPPGRDIGGLDFDALLQTSPPSGIPQRHRRQVTTFINYAKAHAEQFDYRYIPEKRRVAYLTKHDFYRRLARDADSYAPGDIVIIRGFAPWDRFSVPHYHAFYVYESDPVTGMPILLAGNNGRPRILSWEPVMARAPNRSVNYRIRPKLEWLAQAIPDTAETSAGAPTLAAMF